jgi:hypothetical protein
MRTVRSFVFLLAVAGIGAAVAAADGPLTLKGQVTCSECWFEADRKTVAYGTEADVKCAIRCAKGGVHGALAVTEGGTTTLYLLEDGKVAFGEDGKVWTDLTGKQVEATGVVRKEGGKQYLKVDSLKVVEPAR